MPKDQEHIGDRLRAEMQRRSLTPVQVANIFEVKSPSVYDWLDSGRIAKKHLPKLVSEFGRSVEWWITGQESLTTQSNVQETQILNSRERCMLELFSSIPKDEQEAMLRLLEIRNRSIRKKAQAATSDQEAVDTQVRATRIKTPDGKMIDRMPPIPRNKRLPSKRVV